jgi:hypothetical protein
LAREYAKVRIDAYRTVLLEAEALLVGELDVEKKLRIQSDLAVTAKAEAAELRLMLDAANEKWKTYERDYILPTFQWAKELGIDLEALVREKAGKNCVEHFFGALKAKLVAAEAQLEAMRGASIIGALEIAAPGSVLLSPEASATREAAILANVQKRIATSDSKAAAMRELLNRFMERCYHFGSASLTGLRDETELLLANTDIGKDYVSRTEVETARAEGHAAAREEILATRCRHCCELIAKHESNEAC